MPLERAKCTQNVYRMLAKCMQSIYKMRAKCVLGMHKKMCAWRDYPLGHSDFGCNKRQEGLAGWVGGNSSSYSSSLTKPLPRRASFAPKSVVARYFDRFSCNQIFLQSLWQGIHHSQPMCRVLADQDARNPVSSKYPNCHQYYYKNYPFC